jgi:acetyl esterase/lipase
MHAWQELASARTLLTSLLAALLGLAAAPALAQSCQTTSGIVYGTYVDSHGATQSLALDLVTPTGSPGPFPVVLWIHGGGWSTGSRSPIPPPVAALCGHGYAIAAVDYRLSTAAPWPAQIQDCKGAVRFLRAQAATYGLDPDRFAAWGASAGAQLAAMLGTSGGIGTATFGNASADLEGTTGGNAGVSSRVQAVVDWYGAIDFLAMRFYPAAGAPDPDGASSPESRLLGGPIQGRPELAATADPIAFATPDDPPFLVMHGADDDQVPFNQSELLVDALRAQGVPVTFSPVAGAGHGTGAFTTTALDSTVFAFLDGALGSLPAVQVSVAADLPNASEAGAHGRFTLSRTGSTAAPLPVAYALAGTATPAADYTAPASPATIPAGASSVTVDVAPVQDGLVEGDETVVLSLASRPGYRVDSAHPAATVTIADDESAAGLPRVSVVADDPAAAEGGGAGSFTVTRTGDLANGLTVAYTLSGTATNGSDYTALPGTVTIPAGQASAAIAVSALADAVLEPAETVILSLAAGAAYALGAPATASVAIAADPLDRPVVGVVATDPSAAEAGSDPGELLLTRTGSTSSSLTVGITLSGSAASGVDYQPVPATVTFPAGASRAAVAIQPLDGSAFQPATTVQLAVSPQTSILVAPYAGSVVTIVDDPAEALVGYYTVTPCRLLDTRGPAGPAGGPALAAGAARQLTAGGSCGVPAEATAVAANVTLVAPSADGFLTAYPAGGQRPPTSTVNAARGQTRANGAIVPLAGMPPALTVFYGGAAGAQADVVVDVVGYFR